MGNSFGNIGDSFPETEVQCRVHGCKNIVHISSREAMQNVVLGKPRPARMCEECYAKLQTLEDKEMPCSKPGCQGTWVWSRYQQLDAIVSGRGGNKAHGFCQSCLSEMKNAQDQQIACRMKGCKNTWTLTAREQLELGGKPIPHRLCDECFKTLGTLEDKVLKCRVNGCEHTFVWNRFQQLEHLKSGKSLDNPPMRMCDRCFEIFKGLAPQELSCRIRGCKNTWTYSTYEQLEQIVKAHTEAEKKGEAPSAEVPPPPSRMCKECYGFYTSAADIQVPCRNRSCKKTWLYTRSMQLAQKQRGRTQPPSRYCEDCEKILQGLEDKEMPCMQKGCDGTWLYIKDDQLRDMTAGREPQPRRCRRCMDFLNTHPSVDVICEKCGRAIEVSKMQQLECELGVSSKPTLCADCTAALLSEELSSDDTASVISRPKVYIPKSGPWSEDVEIRNWPLGMTREKIEAMGTALRRVVCLGDEMTMSCPDADKGWPTILEANLSSRFEGGVTILNSGIAKCTTAMGLKRFQRDVAPFKPQLVIFSFAFADAMSWPISATEEEQAGFLAQLDTDFQGLCDAIKGISACGLCWIPNPVYPLESDDGKLDPETAAKRSVFFDLIVRQLRKSCEQAGLPAPVDARAMFALFGEQSSRRWMANWFMHNEQGAANIANWIKDEIVSSSLFDGVEKVSLDKPDAPASEEGALDEAKPAEEKTAEEAPQN